MPGRWPYRPGDPVAGEARAFEALAGLDPSEAAARTGLTYDPARSEYIVPSLGQPMAVSVAERDIEGRTPLAREILDELGYLIRLALAWYPALAHPTPPTGRLIAPKELAGGDVFLRGSHRLPLDDLGTRFDADEAATRARAEALAGEPVVLGDAGWALRPLPALPLQVGFWHGDDEFAPRAVLLFDATADGLMPIDLLWGAATYTAMALLG